MGKYFDSKFNKSNNNNCNCPKCRMGLTSDEDIDIDTISAEIQLDDPSETLDAYFELMREADTEDEAMEIMAALFLEGTRYGVQSNLIDDIQMKIETLSMMEYGYDDGS